MLKAEQIPDDLARIADEAYYDTAGDNPTMSDEDIMKHAIAAAINAWPGAEYVFRQPHRRAVSYSKPAIILPLPQEASDE